jgi:hypothetical protein
MQQLMLIPMANPPEETAVFLDRERARWHTIVENRTSQAK